MSVPPESNDEKFATVAAALDYILRDAPLEEADVGDRFWRLVDLVKSSAAYHIFGPAAAVRPAKDLFETSYREFLQDASLESGLIYKAIALKILRRAIMMNQTLGGAEELAYGVFLAARYDEDYSGLSRSSEIQSNIDRMLRAYAAESVLEALEADMPVKISISRNNQGWKRGAGTFIAFKDEVMDLPRLVGLARDSFVNALIDNGSSGVLQQFMELYEKMYQQNSRNRPFLSCLNAIRAIAEGRDAELFSCYPMKEEQKKMIISGLLRRGDVMTIQRERGRGADYER